MNLDRFFILLASSLIMLFPDIYSQPVAGFTLDNSSGCTPLRVSFTNTSTGNPPLTYTWDFGNGNTSLEVNPEAFYTQPGTYTVRLTARSQGLENTYQTTVQVFRSPEVDFTSITRGCIPLQVPFTDLTVKGDADITQWSWDYFDGAPSSTQNPTKTFNQANVYNVLLQVTDANGCKASRLKEDYIEVVNRPLTMFSANPSTGCTVPLTAQFTNNSTGAGNLSYNWTFSTLGSSTLRDPSFTYTNFGTYPVKLKVTSDFGCSDSLTLNSAVNILNINASGVIRQADRVLANDDTICAGVIQFENLSTGSTYGLWEFGDGNTSALQEGAYSMVESGWKTVRLIAQPGDLCADTTSWRIYVDKPMADFSQSINYSCKSPMNVVYTNQSTGNIASWEWTFHDGTKESNTATLNRTYYLPGKTDPYQKNRSATFTTQLIARSHSGCTNQIAKSASIVPPSAVFEVDKVEGCLPLKVTFKDKSESQQPITEFNWEFGNGQTQASSASTVEHTYSNEGEFPSRLIITNNQGCKDTSFFIPIRVGSTLGNLDFVASKTSFYTPEIITLQDNTPEPNKSKIDSWHFTTDNNRLSSCPGQSSVNWKFGSDVGLMDVIYTAGYRGCFTSVTKTDYLDVLGPLGSFSFTLDCALPLEYQFTGEAKSSTSNKWDFGDGTTLEDNLTPVHTYMNPGDYLVQFITFNNGYSDTAQQVIRVRNIQPVLGLESEKCAGDTLLFTATPGKNTFQECGEYYLWDFGDGTRPFRSKNDSVYRVYTEGGTFPVKLTIFGENGCQYEELESIRVYKPNASFEADTTRGCAPFGVNFTNQSTPDENPIVEWSWNFDDGSSPVVQTEEPVTPILHTFVNPGNFVTSLTIKDTKGCIATESIGIGSANPIPYFSVTDPTLCVGDSAIFTLQYNGADSAIWNFGDGVTSVFTSRTVKHKYTQEGVFPVSATVYHYGCSAQEFQPSVFVSTQKADAWFSASDTLYNCYPKQIEFSHLSSTELHPFNSTWDFGYLPGTFEYQKNTVYTYPKPGKFTVTLDIVTTFGCNDKFSRVIEITGPEGDFTISKTEACKNEEVVFEIKDTLNISGYEWDLGDGRLVTGSPLTYQYQNTGQMFPKLVLYGSDPSCNPSIDGEIYIHLIEAKFSVSDSVACGAAEIEFINQSVGYNSLLWDFGNGTTSQETNPKLQLDPGNYNVSLSIGSTIGCQDVAQKTIVVYDFPPMSLTPDTFICVNESIQLFASGGNVVQWDPPTGLSNAYEYNPVANPLSTTTYKVTITQLSSGCENSREMTLWVQQVPTIDMRPGFDTTVVIGEIVQLLALTDSNSVFSWTPDYALSCTDCYNPTAKPLQDTEYEVEITDQYGCFSQERKVRVFIDEKYSLDVPLAFTPNGDGVNDVVHVRGWGVQEVLEFKIFNRWGNMVFQTTDTSIGWDGTMDGKPLSSDTYVYMITIKGYDGETRTKQGTITLMR